MKIQLYCLIRCTIRWKNAQRIDCLQTNLGYVTYVTLAGASNSTECIVCQAGSYGSGSGKWQRKHSLCAAGSRFKSVLCYMDLLNAGGCSSNMFERLISCMSRNTSVDSGTPASCCSMYDACLRYIRIFQLFVCKITFMSAR